METDTPLVSIIMPFYNQSAYIERAVQSALRQTYPSFEVIVVNDGSTEKNAAKVLARLKDPRLTIHHTANQGVSAARNYAIERASGKYIMPLDGDDELGPDYLSEAVPVMEANPRVGITYCRAEFIGLVTAPWVLPPYSLGQMLYENIILSAGLFRRSDWKTVGGYKSDMTYCLEDYDLWLSIIALDREVVCLPKVHYYYRIKFSSRSTILTNEKLLEMRLRTYERHKDLYLRNSDWFSQQVFSHIGETHDLRRQIAMMPHIRLYNIATRLIFRFKQIVSRRKNRAQSKTI
jgi:glycosyltransferase involved in cell wall biosynthesis